MKIVIVGAGALGSHLVPLCRNWDATVKVIDFDCVESKNVQSQLYGVLSLRKNKAMAITRFAMGMFKGKWVGSTAKLHEGNVDVLLQDAELVVDCTDNAFTRDVIQIYCKVQDIPCLHCALSADGDLARIVWTEHFRSDKEDSEGAATCEDGRNLPFHALVAGLIAQVIQRYINDGLKSSWQMTPFCITRLI